MPTTPTDAPTDPGDRRAALLRRGLYPYHDGTRERLADVLVVQMKLQRALPGGDLGRIDALLRAIAPPATAAEAPEPAPIDAGQEPMPAMFEAMVELGRLVGVAFDLPPLDEATGAGLSTQERVDLYGDFLAADAGADDPDEDDEEEDPAGPGAATPAPPGSLFDVPTAADPDPAATPPAPGT